MTFYGWFFLEDETNKVHPLYKLKILPNNIETNFSQTYNNIISLSYDNTDPNQSKLVIEVAENETSTKVTEESINLPLNTWLFIGVTFDYS